LLIEWFILLFLRVNALNKSNLIGAINSKDIFQGIQSDSVK